MVAPCEIILSEFNVPVFATTNLVYWTTVDVTVGAKITKISCTKLNPCAVKLTIFHRMNS